MEGWKSSRMSHAGVSCYDCHVVEKSSPMASQCEGVKGSNIYISPMVSSKTCSRCHPQEVEQFLKSGHAKLASKATMDASKIGGKLLKLQFHYEGAGFMDKKAYKWNEGTPKGAEGIDRAARSSGCQMCHGTTVELGPDNKPINETCATNGTHSLKPMHASPKLAAPVIWDRIIPISKFIWKASTANNF